MRSIKYAHPPNLPRLPGEAGLIHPDIVGICICGSSRGKGVFMTVVRPRTVICPYCCIRAPGFARFCGYCGKTVILNPAGPQYRLVRKVKAGGQGVLFQGVDDGAGLYAIKKLLDNSADADERALSLSMFEREGAILKQLNHARIPRVYDCFSDTHGTRFMVQDYLIGRDLEDILTLLLQQKRFLPVETIYRWTEQICEVLTYVHSRNLIFRDMKPSNLMMIDGGIVVIDFGNVAIASEPQLPYGTGGYAPREQYHGQATCVSDIYALAATLHQLLTGHDPTEHPFQFVPIGTVRSDVPLELVLAIEAGLQENPFRRPQTPEEFMAVMCGHLAVR